MKKTLPFCLILLVLTALTLGAQWKANRAFTLLEKQVCAVETALQTDDFTTAAAAAASCIDTFDTQEACLMHLMPSETLHLFEASVYGMQCYITEENRTEALAEAARAHAQLGAIWAMYLRMI